MTRKSSINIEELLKNNDNASTTIRLLSTKINYTTTFKEEHNLVFKFDSTLVIHKTIRIK